MLELSGEADNETSTDSECRTEQINADFSSCLADDKRYHCNYAFLFGDGYLCTHPKHREFR